MRALIGILLATFFLAGCSSYEQDYRQVGRYSDGYYGGGSSSTTTYYSNDGGYYGGGSTTVYATNNYGYYYPFGNMYYPRDRIWIIGTYGGCNYYTYRGYCYRYRDDFDRVIIWDRQHGYDDNWYRQRENWCRYHDCHHDNIVRDSKGRPIAPPRVERDRMQVAPSPSRSPYPTYQPNRNNSSHWDRDDDDDRHDNNGRGNSGRSWDNRQPYTTPQPVIRNTGSGWQVDNSTSGQPVNQHTRPVMVPRSTNSGWAGSTGNSDNSSRSGMVTRSAPQTSSGSSDASNSAHTNGGHSQNNNSNGGGNGHQRQWNNRRGGGSGDDQ